MAIGVSATCNIRPGHVDTTFTPLGERLERGAPLDAISTPAVLVDLNRMERNLERYQAQIARHGVALRPHVKTHKVPEIALQQLELGAAGVAASKASEAEVFWKAGCTDLVIAYPLIGDAKWRRAADMARTATVCVNVESEVGARGLSQAATEAGVTIGTQIEIDTGLARSGIPADDFPSIQRLARLLMELPGLDLKGVTTYRGRNFEGSASMTNESAGRAEGAIIVELANRLCELGLPVDQVTAGSTATSPAVATVPGITEVRAGAYVFYDGAQVASGSASLDDVALTVLCTVVSKRRGGRVTVDGGSKTFSASGPPAGSDPGGFALAMDGTVILVRLSEEHGVVDVGEGAAEVGQKVEFVPYHASAVVGLADELLGIRDGRCEEIWQVGGRGKRT